MSKLDDISIGIEVDKSKALVMDTDYFIKKFEAIPDEKWCVGFYHKGDAFCAAGHCGERDFMHEMTAESKALEHILADSTADINDGKDSRYPQSTPKARILAALHAARKDDL